MIGIFTLEGILRKSAIFDHAKLEWMNGQYLSQMPPEALYDVVAPQLAALGVDRDRATVIRTIGAVKTRSRTTLDVARQAGVRLDATQVAFDEKATQEIRKDPTGYRAALDASVVALRDAEWTPTELERALRTLADERGVAAGKIFQPIRIALTGGTVSEPVNELLYVVGKEAALARLGAASAAPAP